MRHPILSLILVFAGSALEATCAEPAEYQVRPNIHMTQRASIPVCGWIVLPDVNGPEPRRVFGILGPCVKSADAMTARWAEIMAGGVLRQNGVFELAIDARFLYQRKGAYTVFSETLYNVRQRKAWLIAFAVVPVNIGGYTLQAGVEGEASRAVDGTIVASTGPRLAFPIPRVKGLTIAAAYQLRGETGGNIVRTYLSWSF